jgi:hypothetical protein
MKLPAFRGPLAAVLAAAACLMASGASAPKQALLEPDKLLILSTTDVKGKTSPCG